MLELIDIHHSYESKPLLNGISFTVGNHETVCLLGPSGSGKSTLLRLIAGLEECERGQLLWDGEDLASLPAHRRQFGLVFQDYALFPHLSVSGNVAFGLKMQGLQPRQVDQRVAEALEMVGLAGFAGRNVTSLSGGEQQRVALARALAPRPRLLMFDEPLGALDRFLRTTLLVELRRILHESGVPAIYVTHDQEEAFALADRLLLLHEGRIIQQGAPPEVFARPVSAWAAQFLGSGNLLEGVLRQGRVETPFGQFDLPCTHDYHNNGEPICLLLSHHLATSDAQGQLSARVEDCTFQPGGCKVTLQGGLVFHLPSAPQVGDMLRLHLPATAIQCLTPVP